MENERNSKEQKSLIVSAVWIFILSSVSAVCKGTGFLDDVVCYPFTAISLLMIPTTAIFVMIDCVKELLSADAGERGRFKNIVLIILAFSVIAASTGIIVWNITNRSS